MAMIATVASVPDDLAQEWLQHLRDFDAAHPGCHFIVRVNAPETSMSDMIEALKNIDPPFASMTYRKNND